MDSVTINNSVAVWTHVTTTLNENFNVVMICVNFNSLEKKIIIPATAMIRMGWGTFCSLIKLYKKIDDLIFEIYEIEDSYVDESDTVKELKEVFKSNSPKEVCSAIESQENVRPIKSNIMVYDDKDNCVGILSISELMTITGVTRTKLENDLQALIEKCNGYCKIQTNDNVDVDAVKKDNTISSVTKITTNTDNVDKNYLDMRKSKIVKDPKRFLDIMRIDLKLMNEIISDGVEKVNTKTTDNINSPKEQPQEYYKKLRTSLEYLLEATDDLRIKLRDLDSNTRHMDVF